MANVNNGNDNGLGGPVVLTGISTQKVAHESFHAFQKDHGFNINGTASINEEVRAYLFQKSIAYAIGETDMVGYGSISDDVGHLTDSCNRYQRGFNLLWRGNSFNSSIYRNFQNGSQSNSGYTILLLL